MSTLKNRWVFVDDIINGHRPHALQLFRALKGQGLKWAAQATVMVARDEELLDAAVEAGCRGPLHRVRNILLAQPEEIRQTSTTPCGRSTTPARQAAGLHLGSTEPFGIAACCCYRKKVTGPRIQSAIGFVCLSRAGADRLRGDTAYRRYDEPGRTFERPPRVSRPLTFIQSRRLLSNPLSHFL